MNQRKQVKLRGQLFQQRLLKKNFWEVNGHYKPRSKLNCIYITIAEDLSFLCNPNHFSSKAIICVVYENLMVSRKSRLLPVVGLPLEIGQSRAISESFLKLTIHSLGRQ